jgi:hypothetical protein
VKTRTALGLPLATLLFTAAAVIALRAGGHTAVATMGARYRIAPAAAMADRSPTQPPAAIGTPDSAAERMRHVFHELHADGRNAQCEVCDSQYRTA